MPKITLDLRNIPQLTNEKFLPLYQNESRYLVLMGGGGSGKSVFTAQKLVFRLLTEKGHRFLVCRKVARTMRDSVFALMRGVISDWGMSDLFDVNKSDMKITCKLNGNEMLFAGLDDVEKLKSIYNITGIWIEEASEIEVTDFRQLDIRLRGETQNYKQIMITFNPISITHWLKTEFFDKLKPDTTTLHSTYKDNRFLDAPAIRVLEGFKETDPYYYQVYCLGEWGVIGNTVFDAEKVSNRLRELKEAERTVVRGNFVYDYKNEQIVDRSIKFIEDMQGFVTIYEQPISKVPYVLAGDTAEGGIDNSAGQVLNNITGKQAAVWHGHIDTDLYAKQMYCLGKYYNKALIAIECNFDLHPIKELQRLGYFNQYKREVIDEISKKKQHKYGFMTTAVTRPVIIAELVKIVRECIELINDIPTLEEMLTFVRNQYGKPEAMEGKHDDLIMALAIAYKAREQQSMEIEQEYESYEYEAAFGRTGY